MKISKKLKIAVGSIFMIFFLLFLILVVHIATAKPLEVDNASLQISRIDFKEPIDSLKAKEIHRNLKSIPGVKTDRLNKETGVLVYFHDIKVADSKTIYNKLMAMGNYKAERFVLPKELENKKACPVMTEDSFSYKFSRGIQRIFN
ncbi:hypothetical protein B0I03_102413 [Flavobacterium aquaticum]|uniref:Uncharacterized protein n=1 Tax=Flavobacterium aquaticum TaxID=1236486 RepID=A0A327YVG0_9FLAO|nr:hypothetical protein [Flavobacterium aquaticum]RAK24551.1 hypothetical protein B0I03_102413 [Flavobacterium aquaticum]